MPKKQSTEVAVQMSDATLELLKQSFPVEASFQRILLPRISMRSQDLLEGKGKSARVTEEAGTFFTETQVEELDENGKKKWVKKDLGKSIEVIIFFRRKQLKFFDGEKYTSSPIYDTDDQVVPLFRDKVEVNRGTPAELKARKEYQGVSAKGKAISKLEENRILYILHEGQIYQLSIRGTSMYAFMTYAKSLLTPSSVLTKLGSEEKQNGSISWSQMTFEVVRNLTSEEGKEVLQSVKEIENSVETEKQFFANQQPKTDTDDQNAIEVAKFNSEK